MLYKFFWFLRAILYRGIFGHFGFPSYIGRPVFLSGTRSIMIGKRVRIFPGARMESIRGGSLVIGDNTAIGQDFHITAAHSVIICKNTTISGNVFITDIDHDYTQIDTHIMNQKHIVKPTYIGENCFIGYGARIQAGTTLGKQCVVGTNAVVRGEFPDYCVIAGVPAKIIKRYNPKKKKWEKVSGRKK